MLVSAFGASQVGVVGGYRDSFVRVMREPARHKGVTLKHTRVVLMFGVELRGGRRRRASTPAKKVSRVGRTE